MKLSNNFHPAADVPEGENPRTYRKTCRTPEAFHSLAVFPRHPAEVTLDIGGRGGGGGFPTSRK